MGHGVASSQVWAISLAWVRFHKRVIIPVALLFGALTFSRNAAITMRLSSTLSERSRLEEAVILPTIARQKKSKRYNPQRDASFGQRTTRNKSNCDVSLGQH
mmetsp:Transcript_12910/g.22721  ORF Transcript_12910/g.22721 Transcript_12910/m.22721 type:complete len:102 (+) Transcript_12910:34-339(+)